MNLSTMASASRGLVCGTMCPAAAGGRRSSRGRRRGGPAGALVGTADARARRRRAPRLCCMWGHGALLGSLLPHWPPVLRRARCTQLRPAGWPPRTCPLDRRVAQALRVLHSVARHLAWVGRGRGQGVKAGGGAVHLALPIREARQLGWRYLLAQARRTQQPTRRSEHRPAHPLEALLAASSPPHPHPTCLSATNQGCQAACTA
jgi:hypothetical protein